MTCVPHLRLVKVTWEFHQFIGWSERFLRERKIGQPLQEFYLTSLGFFNSRMAFQPIPTMENGCHSMPFNSNKKLFLFHSLVEAISSPFNNISLLRDVANSLITSPYFFEWIWELHFDENDILFFLWLVTIRKHR